MEEERTNYAKSNNSYEAELQRLTEIINDLERRQNYEKNSSGLEEQSSKKSVDLKSSRRARSREKDHTKEVMQDYI